MEITFQNNGPEVYIFIKSPNYDFSLFAVWFSNSVNEKSVFELINVLFNLQTTTSTVIFVVARQRTAK